VLAAALKRLNIGIVSRYALYAVGKMTAFNSMTLTIAAEQTLKA
jgi:hypothetical protein